MLTTGIGPTSVISSPSTRARPADGWLQRDLFSGPDLIHSSIDCISYSVHCGLGLAASALCAIPFATATDAVILDSVLSFIRDCLAFEIRDSSQRRARESWHCSPRIWPRFARPQSRRLPFRRQSDFPFPLGGTVGHRDLKHAGTILF